MSKDFYLKKKVYFGIEHVDECDCAANRVDNIFSTLSKLDIILILYFGSSDVSNFPYNCSQY